MTAQMLSLRDKSLATTIDIVELARCVCEQGWEVKRDVWRCVAEWSEASPAPREGKNRPAARVRLRCSRTEVRVLSDLAEYASARLV
jgi:hypothetical protein